MKILHIVEDFSFNSGGLRTVIKNLHHYLVDNGHESIILSAKSENEDFIELVEVENHWLYSKKWIYKIKCLYKENKFDIIHIHGVWMFPQYISAKFCVKKNIPFILSPHGMYEPWLWTKGTFKKKIYFNTLTKSYFSKAFRIHSITNYEKENLNALFPHTKQKEIPNLITIKNENKQNFSNQNKRYILFLGRLDEKKGIDLLIQAFANLNFDCKLVIAGGFNNYKETLHEIIKSLGIENKVIFKGMVTGEDKIILIKKAWVLVSPSFSEAIGMVNLEAAALKTPIITTHQTGIKKDINKNGAILINPSIKELEHALVKVIEWRLEERILNGEMIFNFVKKNYSWEKKFKDWLDLYECAIARK